LEKENEQLEKVIANSLRQLGNESFVAKAPAHVIDGMRAKLAEYQAQLAKNQAALTE
jgi:valyl-tRNA synthetase